MANKIRDQGESGSPEKLSWGGYDLPLEIVTPQVTISLQKIKGGVRYSREKGEDRVSKVILSDYGNLYLNPTEPLNTPKAITSYLLLEFKEPVIVDPKTSTDVLVTVPVETACLFYHNERDFTIIDIFSLTPPKFTLYGNVDKGLVCKYWKTDIYSSLPQVDPQRIGVMELNIINNSSRWVEVSRALFSAYGMKIYYKADLVSLKASMKIINERISETDFFDAPLEAGMESSIELFSQRRILFGSKMIMEEGY